MGLVADDELVRAPRQLVAVAGEPGVRLDGEGVRPERLLAAFDRVDEAVAVSLRREVAAELVDEEAAVGEDEDAEVARGLDEPRCRDRLAGRGRVAEAVSA